jgi:hypothetical protein
MKHSAFAKLRPLPGGGDKYPRIEMTIDCVNRCFYLLEDDRPVARFNDQRAANACLDELIEKYSKTV